MLRTTLTTIAARKARLAATSVAILLGVAFMAGTLVLTDTVGRTFDTLYADARAGTDTWVRGETQFRDSDFGDQRARIDASLVGVVAGAAEVEAAEAVIETYAQVVGADGEAVGDPAWGPPTFGANWRTDPRLNPFQIAEGRAPSGPGEVVVDRGTARAGDLAVGDATTVLTAEGSVAAEVVGVATFAGADSPGGASFALFATDVAADVLGADDQIDAVAAVAAPGVSQDEAAEALSGLLPAGVEAISGDQLVEETRSEVAEALGFFNAFMVTFAVVALFVGSFIIYNTFSILVAQRSREHALLRAIGASRRQVLASVVTEAGIVGLVASIAGLAAGVGVAGLLRALLAGLGIDIPAEGLVVTARTVVISVLAGVGVSLAAAALPARRASRVAPVAALRETAVDPSGTSRVRSAVGGTLVVAGGAALAAGLFAGAGLTVIGLGAATVFVGLAVVFPVLVGPVCGALGAPLTRLRGTTGELARNNALRNPKRTASTAAALMVGVALVASVTVMASSVRASVTDIFDRTLAGDVVVDSGQFLMGGFSPQLTEDLAEVPGVETAMALRGTVAEIDGSTHVLFGADPDAANAVFDLGVTQGAVADLGAGEIAVLESTAERQGLGLGDAVEVRFAETGDQHLTVAAIYQEEQPAGEYFVGLAAFEANVAEQRDMTTYLALAEGADPAATLAAVEDVTAAYPQVEVMDQGQYKAAQAAQLDPMLNLVYALLGMAVLIALLGIANTLALSVLERTREIGLLRAVGMSRSQVRATVRWESVLIALLGASLGLAVGAGFGWALTQALRSEGMTVFVLPAPQLVVIAGLAAAAGVVAALGPARRASRLDLLAAIGSE